MRRHILVGALSALSALSVLSVLLAGCAAPRPIDAGAEIARASPISGAVRTTEFSFSPPHSPAITVFMQLPAEVNARTEIIFALHGTSRNAKSTFRAWRDHVGTQNLIVVAPLFAEADYPSGRFSEGNVTQKSLAPTPPAEWTFNVIEALFDHVRAATGASAAQYLLYGHSAGGQFVHRMAMTMPPSARVKQLYAANSGWYLMPDTRVAYPYGLGASLGNANPNPNEIASCVAYTRPLVVLLGEADNDPTHFQLRRSAEAMKQGRHRFERGQNFFAAARRDAAARGCAFNWSLHTVPGAAHEHDKMAAATLALLNDPAPNTHSK